MSQDQQMIQAVYQGWHAYQETLIKAISPLTADQLKMRSAPDLLSVGEIATHIVKNRAVWFYFIMGEGGKEFETFGRWDVYGEISTNAKEIILGLEKTWNTMHEIISNWRPEDWKKTFPDEDDDNTPDVLTRPWIVWHMIEHDIHHAGEISIMLGSFGLQGLKLSG
ncbi:MAG: DinB family protein [Anaerolineales bacterium]|jgi:uncharacterized damage-inducible protein DinB